MKTASLKISVLVTAVVVLTAAFAALAQGPGGGPGGPGQGGMGGPGGGRGMMPPPPPVTVVVSDGAVYVAADGKLIAFEAKTLKKLAEAKIGDRQAPPPPRED